MATLAKTLSLNLYCGYITVDGLSYKFDPNNFSYFANQAEKVSWSRISFQDLDLLKTAIATLDKAPDVYWYEDVEQYNYPGFCMINVNGLHWDTDLDSLYQVVQNKIVEKTRLQGFLLAKVFPHLSVWPIVCALCGQL